MCNETLQKYVIYLNIQYIELNYKHYVQKWNISINNITHTNK